MPVTIPLRTDAVYHYDLQVVLDGAVFTLELRWNTRDEAWYMDLRTEAGDPILTSVKVVVDWPLAGRCVDARRPAGALFAIDTSSERRDPGKDDLGSRVILVYFESAELPVAVP